GRKRKQARRAVIMFNFFFIIKFFFINIYIYCHIEREAYVTIVFLIMEFFIASWNPTKWLRCNYILFCAKDVHLADLIETQIYRLYKINNLQKQNPLLKTQQGSKNTITSVLSMYSDTLQRLGYVRLRVGSRLIIDVIVFLIYDIILYRKKMSWILVG
ncbi:hypothetical protein ACJX0J_017602, partial [Zea mays]